MGKKRNSIGGQFSALTIEMLRSPAYRVLSLAAHKILIRLQIEHAQHGGTDNGKLPCTYTHFEEFGIHRHGISPAMREVVALGFVEITVKGRAHAGEFRSPSKYRLTFRWVGDQKPTDEWKNIKTLEMARAVAKQARALVRRPPRPVRLKSESQ